ncbi:MFS transporter [Azospirillum soli]|uniref:MFS transporter n=1 Tax=Azospirillum soli TaxID=1304799 RepID=UPI001AEA0C6B|nr:MFS transporter [Azospirillum soli]MBP2315372.1 MFS family permease [Azospirillum soli]
MPNTTRTVRSLLVGVALLMLGNGGLGTLVSVRLDAAGFGSLAIGIVGAAYFAGLTAGSLFAYTVIIRVGHIRAFAAAASVLSAASLAHALSVDPTFWALLRITEGFCMASLYMCIESWLNDVATNETRGRLLSLYMVTLYGATALGQQLLNLQDPERSIAFMLISILLSLALVPVALTRTSPPALPDIVSFSFARLYRASPLGVAGVFVSGMVIGSIYGLAPVFGTASGFGVSGTALFMTVLISGGMLLQWPLGRLSDRFDRRAVIIGLSLGLAAVSAGMIGVAGLGGQLGLLLVAVLFGGLSFTLYPLCLAHTNDHVDRSELVAASGGLILAFSVGATVGPMLASATMEAIGPAGLFVFIVGCGLAAGLFGLWRTQVRPPVPADEQGSFQPVPQTTPVAVPLDPRHEPRSQDDVTKI